jgi:hypothetical protein
VDKERCLAPFFIGSEKIGRVSTLANQLKKSITRSDTFFFEVGERCPQLMLCCNAN